MSKRWILFVLLTNHFLSGQNVVQNPTATQTITQPSATVLNVNSLEQVRFADQFAWTQSPTSPSSISSSTCPSSVCVVTINAVRGINTYSASLTHHRLYLAGTGTPEVVLITATTCTGSSTGTCTVTFTVSNTHAAGYTLGTSTAGYQEAYLDALITNSGINPVTGFRVMGSPINAPANIAIFQGTLSIDQVMGSVAPVIFDGNGATVACKTSNTDCILVGSTGNANQNVNVTIENFQFIPAPGIGRAANGNQTIIHDTTQNTKIRNNHWGFISTTDVFDYLVKVDNDQSFLYESNRTNTGNGPPMSCDTAWCGAALYASNVDNGALGTVRDNDFYMNCKGNAIDWTSGNGLKLAGMNVIQNFNQWGVRYWRHGGEQDFSEEGNTYFESGTCTNPDFGDPGYLVDWVVLGGARWTSSGESHGEDVPKAFVNDMGSPSKVYAFYVVGNDGAGHKTIPLFAGNSFTNITVAFNVKWKSFGASTYDLLAVDVTTLSDDNSAPFGTDNWAVTTGIVCSGASCSQAVTLPLSLSSYTVDNGSNWYSPSLGYWPIGGAFMGSNGTCTAETSLCVPVHYGVDKGVLVSTLPPAGAIYYSDVKTSLVADSSSPGYYVTGGRRFSMIAMNTQGGSGGGILINPLDDQQTLNNRKGKLNFSSWSWSGSQACNLTLYDSNPLKTSANNVNRPSWDIGDSCIGYDNQPNTMAFMNSTSVSFYINQVMDNTNFKERLTASLKTFQVPISSTVPTGTAPLVITSTTPVANLTTVPITYSSSGSQITAVHLVKGSASLSSGTVTVNLSGAAVFTNAGSFACSVNRTVTTGVSVSYSSGSKFVITSASSSDTDAVRYMCIGN